MPDFSPTEYAVPGFVALVLIEMLWARRARRDAYEPRDTLTSLAFGLGSTVSALLFGGVFVALYMGLWQFRLFDVPWTWWAFALCFVLDDLAYYWVHRFGHRVRWFWASHVNHHSSQHYNLTTALRQPWISPFTLKFLWLGSAMVFLGFHPAMVAFVGAMNLIYQFWIHTEAIKRCPAWFEAVFNTPSHHRVHHGSDPEYLDRNYGGILIVWDRLFGTYRAQPEQGHEGMDIGIDLFREAEALHLHRMLAQPFIGEMGEYPINRRDWDK